MAASRVRTLFGRFFLEDEIGAGAAGVVYWAKDSMLGTTVALKVIHPELVGDREVRERFKREITLSRRVQHPGVCRIYDLHEIEEGGSTLLALAMELLEGKTLAQEIHDELRLTAKRTQEVLAALVPALTAAHEAGVVHRDLKPGNVLVTTSGAIKLLDFGMATADDVMKVTRPGNTVGSLRFIAPEVWEGEPASPASNLYALGVILYACLSGKLPYEAKSPAEMFNAIKRPPPTLMGQNIEVTPAIDAVVQKAMSRRPNERHKSARALLEDFTRATEAGSTAVTTQPVPMPAQTPRTPPPLPPSSSKADDAFFESPSRPRPRPGNLPLAPRPIPPPIFVLLTGVPLFVALVVAAAAHGPDAKVQPPRIRDASTHLVSWNDAPDPDDPLTLTPTDPPDAHDDDTATDAPHETPRETPHDTPRHDRPRSSGGAGELRSQLNATMSKRGIQMADVPDVDALDKKARKLEQQGDTQGAKDALTQAKAMLDKVQIDRGFIMSKQKRLTKILDKASSKTRDKVRPIENDIAKAFAARDYALANLNINRALLQASK